MSALTLTWLGAFVWIACFLGLCVYVRTLRPRRWVIITVSIFGLSGAAIMVVGSARREAHRICIDLPEAP